MIVQIAMRGQTRTAARQDGCNHFLGGGLAVAAGDRHDGYVEIFAPSLRQYLQRAQRIADYDLRQCPRPRWQRNLSVDQCSDGTALSRTGNKCGTDPRAAAEATNSLPSKFGPRSATNSAPALKVRLSVETMAYGRSSPIKCPPTALAAACKERLMRRSPGNAWPRADH